MPNNNTVIEVLPEPKKKRGVAWRNNVNVRNITYTRKGPANNGNRKNNNFNRNVINYKGTMKNVNGPAGKSVSRLTRNNPNIMLPPEHSFGERYFTDETWMTAKQDFKFYRKFFGADWQDAEVYLDEHPEVYKLFENNIEMLRMKTEKAIERQMRSLSDQGFLPENEIRNFYDIQRRKVVEKYKAGQTNARSAKTFLGYYDIDERAAIKKIKPEAAEVWDAVLGGMRRDFSKESDKLSAAMAKEVIAALKEAA